MVNAETEALIEAARSLLETIDRGAPHCVGYTINSVPVWRNVLTEKADALRRLLPGETPL
jgi:hypothetical protein